VRQYKNRKSGTNHNPYPATTENMPNPSGVADKSSDQGVEVSAT
jgi:hypothetical protein